MTQDKTICIVRCAAATPVGTTARMSGLMVLADIVRFLSHPECKDADGRPVILGLASYLDELYTGTDRMILLLESALAEMRQFFHENLPEVLEHNLPVFLGTPEIRPGFDKYAIKQIKERLNESNMHVLPQGHASGIMAIEKAGDYLKSEGAFCLAGGVDSYCNPVTLAWLNAQDRLKLSGNRFGFIPGEASGLLFLTTKSTARQYNLPILATIVATATENEENTITKDKISKGRALSRAMAEVLEFLPRDQKISRIFCDLNGEQYRSDEYGYACLNNGKYFNFDKDNLTVPSASWGDIGAATSPNLINLAITSIKHDSYNLVWTSSDSGKRSTLLLKIHGGEKCHRL